MEWVNTPIDSQLLRAYLEQGSEDAFAELARRHMDLVYSASLRMVRDPHLAEDVTQSVFVALARNASQLVQRSVLSGWLHRTAQNISVQTVRTIERRRTREQQASVMNELLAHESDATWKQIAPHLDDALGVLSESDRDALMLRYFERKSAEEMAQVLGISSEAAQKRVTRAIERIRESLIQRGITPTTGGLAILVEAHAVAATPPTIAENILRGTRSILRPTGRTVVTSPRFRLGWSWAVAMLLIVGIGGLMWMNRLADRNSSSKIPSRSDVADVTSESSGQIGHSRPKSNVDERQSGGALTNSSTNQESSVKESGLILSFVTQDTGDPVPHVKVEYRGSEGSHFTKAQFTASPSGEVKIRILPGTTRLELASIAEGFNDVRLNWNLSKGDRIPERRQVRLQRAILIGGTVLDPDGNPVSGATVGWGNLARSAFESSEESHEVSWIETTTDRSGQWRLQRISASILPWINGRASHPNFQPSEMVGYPAQPEHLRDDLEKDLIDLKHVFRLQRASFIEGVVMEDGGAPISGALVRVGYRNAHESRETRTDSNGRFTLHGGPTGATALTAEAKGFAAKTLQVTLQERNDPFQISLAKGVPLRIRVVETNGVPVPNAFVWLNTMPPSQVGIPQSAPQVQASFEGRSDAEGRTVWEDAPTGIHQLDIEATGFMRRNRVRVPADGDEHEIMLYPALVLQGTVTDADTGKPIPHFRLALGWPSLNELTGKTRIQVSGLEPFTPNFSDGQFRHVLTDKIYISDDPKLMVRFESDGYQPVVSRIIQYEEGVVTLDVSLERSETLEMTVVDIEGRPAPGAMIGLVTPGSRLLLGPNGLVQRNNPGPSSLLRADEEGRVTIQKDPEVRRIVATGNQGTVGFSETTWAELQSKAVLTLAPWGRIRGRVLGTAGALEGKGITLGERQQGPSDFHLDFKTQTDGEGGFEFAKAPAGLVRVQEQFVERSGDVTMFSVSRTRLVTVTPGQVAEVTLGGSIRVSGHLILPSGFQPRPNGALVVVLSGPVQSVPSPEEGAGGPATIKRQQLLTGTVDAAGGFVVAGIEPGICYLSAKWIQRPPEGQTIWEKPTHLEPVNPIKVVIPENSGPIDLGEVLLRAPSKPATPSGPKS